MNFVESAETAALGRALKDAGFGTQFCDIALPNDQTIVDAGVHIAFDIEDEILSGHDEDGIPVSEESEITTETEEKKSSASKSELKPPKEEKVVLTADMPVEELLGKMTVEFAKEIVVDYGYDKGKTLGELAQNRPQGVQYHASKAKNNLIRAGAMFLLEQAKGIAYVTLCEPTCGSGVMVIAAANSLYKNHYNPSQNMCVLACDNDIRCAKMTYIQLSYLGIPAVVIHGDTLLVEEYARYYTPVYMIDGWLWRHPMTLTKDICLSDEKLKCINF